MSMTALLKDSILERLFLNPIVYVGLLDAADREIRGEGYARQLANFNRILDSVASSDEAIRFPKAKSDWGRVHRFGLFGSRDGKDLLGTGPLSATVEIEAGERIEFEPGALTVAFAPAGVNS